MNMHAAILVLLVVGAVVLLRTISKESFQKNTRVPIYIINLERRPDRLRQCLAQFSPNQVRVVRAVDGYDIETEKPSPMTLGEIGCFLSHQKAVELIATHTAPYGIVLEDDAVIEHSPDRLSRILASLPTDTDVVALGCNSLPPSKMHPVIGELYALHEYDLYGTHALLYTKRGAAKVLEAMKAAGPHQPFDVWLGRHPSIKMYVVSPPLARPRHIQDSETQKTR